MYRYLKEAHETGHLYFTDNKNCEKCMVCGDRDYIIWCYDITSPKHEFLISLFYLIINDLKDIKDSEDLKILDNELHFDLDLFNKFNTLLKMQKQLNDYEDKYRLFKEGVLSCVRKLEKTDIGPNGFGSTGTK